MPPFRRTRIAVFVAWSLIAFALVTLGCASSPERSDEGARQEPTGLEPGIYAVETGEKLSREALYRRLAEPTYVVVGESHDTTWHHAIQRDIFAAVLERRDGRVALGMEMFERPYQEALDAYVGGEHDEETMLDRTDWESSWGMDASLYRPLWETAREHRVPIAALNVPRELTRRIAREGLEGLSDEQRSRLPDEIDTSIEAQRRYLRDVFAQHGGHGGEMQFEHFLQAQASWDETMADSAVEFVESRREVEAMVVVAGRVHARKSFGIPPRIVRRLGGEASGEVAVLLPYDAGEQTVDGPLTLEHLREQRAADYVWIGPPDRP